ncbi:hypothetical protein OSB04_006109 [Centaurea solstitialis]|uniref:Leucine-rich repeat-containing N-terminal plant-type domain-containing protein n=1 Tax=Centaurea solstitialis TaxID=347529 RepID=A0AA38TJ19_9ASTR|nr:hypothetical protein OSB04_006109 [Centaurea solstitialis]
MAPCFQYFTFLPKFFLFTLLLVTCIQSLLTHDDECMALYLFKQSFPRPTFEAPGFQKFDSWKITSNASNDGSDCCFWDGVACSDGEDDGHVIGLDLGERYLRGHINSNSTLFNLAHLQTLNLAMNDFTGSQIPSQISRLKQLRSLDLSDAGLSGQIPTEISHLMPLSLLDLSRNSLKLQSPSLEKLVQNLTRLEELDLSWVEISSSVPHFLANFSSLRSIKLRDCLLQNEFPILQLPKLKLLDVGSNSNLTGFLPEFQNHNLLEELNLNLTGFSGGIPKSIKNLNHLTLMGLGMCSFSGIIPGALTNMTQLTYLDLSYNEFTGVVPSLAGLTELTYLELSVNSFEKGCLPEWLVKLTKLKELYATRMNLSGEIPPFLANLTKLIIFDMRINSLCGRIPSSFMNLTQLSTIRLRQNHLQGPISSSFSNFKSLQVLSLSDNSFSGRVELNWFARLSELKALILGRNKISFVATNNYTNDTFPQLDHLDLSSCNLKEFPPFLRFQHKIKKLFLNDNQIHGLIPEWVWNNSRETLEMINLADNFITGFHQHQHFPSLTRLKYFVIGQNLLHGRLPVPPRTTEVYSARNNNLEGEIPPLICQVKSLRFLSLSSNNITGILPPCFGSLSNSLFEFDLSKNKLQGTMMDSFKQDNRLRSIDLSGNQFVGQVPKSLTNCSNLEVLSLGDNFLDDVFPFWLGTLVELQVLILRSNKFYGEIQGLTITSSQFPKLRIIDLSNNGFSGQLPHKYFQSWKAMKVVRNGQSSYMKSNVTLDGFVQEVQYSMTITYKSFKTKFEHILKILVAIDLSCNKLEGEIPQSLQDLYGLQSLNLSNNHFTGHVLSSLGKLKNLEALDLSRNKLSEETPQQLLQLDFLAILNLSFNHLDGRIPQGMPKFNGVSM